MTEKFPRQNPFLELKFYESAAISTLVLAFFPVSVIFFWLAFGTQTTRDLIEAMVKDWVQTLMIIISLVVLLLGGLVWGLIEWLS
jgi:uncharacterized membrane protein